MTIEKKKGVCRMGSRDPGDLVMQRMSESMEGYDEDMEIGMSDILYTTGIFSVFVIILYALFIVGFSSLDHYIKIPTLMAGTLIELGCVTLFIHELISLCTRKFGS